MQYLDLESMEHDLVVAAPWGSIDPFSSGPVSINLPCWIGLKDDGRTDECLVAPREMTTPLSVTETQNKPRNEDDNEREKRDS